MEVYKHLNDNLMEYIGKHIYKDNITEIRLRADNCVQLTVNGENEVVSDVYMTQKQISDILYNMCHKSMNIYDDEISEGYITLKDGCRVGISGEYYHNSELNKNILKNIKSLNIRIPGEIIRFENQEILFNLQPESTLIIGPPHSGKTSLLKIYIKYLSKSNRITLCDERKEFYMMNLNCDFISGIKKSDGILMATRSLNPQFIVCDEIGDKKEAENILSAVNTGVKFICTAHGDSFDNIINRPNIKVLIENNIFARTVTLKHKNRNFYIEEIRDV